MQQTPDNNIEWFVKMVDIGTYKIANLQKQYAKLLSRSTSH